MSGSKTIASQIERMQARCRRTADLAKPVRFAPETAPDVSLYVASVPPIGPLIERAAWIFGVTPDLIVGRSRAARHSRARAAVAWAARQNGRSYSQIGRVIGGRDHTTMIHHVQRAEQRCERDPAYRAKCEALLGMGVTR